MRIYVDVCCLNRPFDRQDQERVRLETEAIREALEAVRSGEHVLVSSDVVTLEVEQIAEPERRRSVRALLPASEHVAATRAEEARAAQLAVFGFHQTDARHIACAESGGADVFLTTDDQLVRAAVRHRLQLRLRVLNPVTWLQET